MLLEYPVNRIEKLLFWGEAFNTRDDFFIKTNCLIKEIDLIIFLDSRGISANFDTSLVKMILDEFEYDTNYLIVARPIEITTWVTLYNFLKLNKLNSKRIITNMGFVDFTPKKRTIVELYTYQYKLFFSSTDIEINKVGKFINKHGESEILFEQKPPQSFLKQLKSLFKIFNVVLIDTPYVSSDIKFKRVRPKVFYDGLNKTSLFHDKIQNLIEKIDLPEFTIDETYDAVHYTYEGNLLIFNKIKTFLKLS